MYWIDKFKLAEIHRETYAAILKSWVPHGKKEEFARKCGITREYFSCLCAANNRLDGARPSHLRSPSPSLAIKIAENLPAPDEVRKSLVENMELAHIFAVEVHYLSEKVFSSQLLHRRLEEIGRIHRQATFGKDLAEVNRSYRVVRDASLELLFQIKIEENPDSFVQTCLYYHDAQCVLNRPEEALRYAKVAQLVLENIEGVESGYSIEQRNDLEINAIRGEAVAYHNLKLDPVVPDILLNRACRTSAYRNKRPFWQPLVMRDFINSVVDIPRFSIREVHKIATEIESICEKNDDHFTLMLVREARLRSCIQRDKFSTAQHILNEEMERLPLLPYVGALHRVLLLKSGAHLAWRQKDKDAWHYYIHEAVRLMRDAGLSHQFNLTRQEYGARIDKVLSELE